MDGGEDRSKIMELEEGKAEKGDGQQKGQPCVVVSPPPPRG